MIMAAKETNTDRIELYTEEYARNYTKIGKKQSNHSSMLQI